MIIKLVDAAPCKKSENNVYILCFQHYFPIVFLYYRIPSVNLNINFMKQIRAHAKYLGIPLLGDEVYGGTKNMALSLLQPKTPPRSHGNLSQLISGIERPCLHALTLG